MTPYVRYECLKDVLGTVLRLLVRVLSIKYSRCMINGLSKHANDFLEKFFFFVLYKISKRNGWVCIDNTFDE